MTTGTTGTDPSSITWVGAASYRTWSGSNGKYETVGGRKRIRWNNYTCTYRTRVRSSSVVRGLTKPSPKSTVTPVVRDFTCRVGFSVNPDFDLKFNNNDQLRLLGQLLEKIKSHDFNLAVPLGEMNKTADMVGSNLRKLGRSILALKRGDFTTAARQLGARPRGTRLKASDVSGRWLELQYGWMPLLSDTYAAAKAFEAISSGPKTTRFTTSIHKEQQREGSTSPSLWSYKYHEKLSRYLRAEVWEELSLPRQLGLLDPLSLAWELTPYSFVVDWFIPIGNYFDVLNQVPALKGRFMTTDVRKKQGFDDVTIPVGKYTSGYWLLAVIDRPHDFYRETKVTRTTSTNLSVPLPTFTPGGLAAGKRVWNAIALAHQRFRP